MKSFLIRLVGVAIFVYLLLAVVDLPSLWAEVSSLPIAIFLLIVPLHLLQWILRVCRCRVLIRDDQVRLAFKQVFVITAASFLIGCLSPGRIAEMAKVKFLMNAGYPFRKSFLSFLVERLTDILALLVYVLLGVVVTRSLFPAPLLGACMVFAVLGVVSLLAAPIRQRVFGIGMRCLPFKITDFLKREIDYIRGYCRGISTKGWTLVALHSIAIWGINCVMIFVLFSASSFSLPSWIGISFTAFGSLMGLLPISIYGMGIREWMFIHILTLYGYPPEQADVAAFVFGLMYLVILVYHIVLGFFAWINPVMQPFFTQPAALSE